MTQSSPAVPAASHLISAKTRIPALDGIRGIAVLMVICFHFTQAFLHGWVVRLAAWEQTGIDLFFVLSGFLITGIVLDSKNGDRFLRNFYARRILRIFPLYYAALVVYFIVYPLLHLTAWAPWARSFWYWIFLQNVPATFAPAAIDPGPGHLWSVAVEEHFYLIWPYLVLKFDKRALLKITAFAVALAIATRIALFGYGTFYFTLARFDSLAIGSALAIFARMQPAGLLPLVGRAKVLLPVLVLALAGTELVFRGDRTAIAQVSRSTLIALVYACVLVLAVEDKLGRFTGIVLRGPVLGAVAKCSYGMYVIHPFLIFWLVYAGLPTGLFGLVASILCTYAAAWLSWTLYERQFLRLKRYYNYGQPLAVGASPSRP